ncbi:MAG: two-component system, OmpR family, response regulator [Actinomycetota bacterium]|nr:two-component system, OmpR family, response regulator [Actinomycetota bacterium]
MIEDEPRVASAIGRGLRNHGYAVDISGDGVDGLWKATEYEYDAIILDLMIPGVEGIELCTTLRSRGRWAPVLMLTARGSVQDRIRGLDAGADDYLVKPFAFGELLARLRSLTRGRAGERPAVLEVADVVLDPARHLVQRDGRDIPLSPREFALLEFLMRRAGAVVTRTEILDHVWDYGYDGISNVVNVYVGHLRKKLEGPFGGPLIRTVPGVGYVLDQG